ncbi:MAG TPA: TIGR00282 family metallophosphoesterase [Spirochaetia bacterium]|nr:TIGR00282 family metallophosphoesterase [Spirochaetia bacterium]
MAEDTNGLFKVLFIGEIVGSSGVFCVKKLLPQIRRQRSIDFVIANGNGTTGGFGIGKNHAIYLHKLGIDVITAGECIYYKLDMVTHISRAPYILRAANYPYGNPGRGWNVYEKDERRVGVISILGQSGFPRVHLTNPFHFLPGLVAKMQRETPTIIVDFHAASTGEKSTMFHFMDGKVTAIIGTHFRVLTSDDRILPGGSAVITDAGRTGSLNSVGGLDPEIEINKFITQIPERSKSAWEKLEFQGVILYIDENGKTKKIETLRLECKEAPDDRKGNNFEDQHQQGDAEVL